MVIDESKTTPIGLARYAREFMEAALAADDKMGFKQGHEIIAPVPVMYLVGHSIELALKSFLVHKGVSLNELRKQKKYGHNLVKCFKKAKELGLLNIVRFTKVEVGAMEVLNDLYSTKELNYISTGFKAFPAFGPIESFSRKLLNEICPLVGYK